MCHVCIFIKKKASHYLSMIKKKTLKKKIIKKKTDQNNV